MEKYEIEFEIKGKFNKGTFDKFDNTFIITTNSEGKTIISILLEAKSPEIAISLAQHKINRLLELYSLYTLSDLELENERYPKSLRKPPSKKYLQKWTKLDATIGTHFDIKVFTTTIQEYWNVVNQPKNMYIVVATDFLKRARLDGFEENTIIDCFVSLEALFSKEEEKTEMRYRLSNRIAVFLGNNKKNRLKIRSEIRDLYDLRSKIVHGSVIKSELNKGMLVPIVRESILRFLHLASISYTHSQIVEKIDDAIIDNQIAKELQKESSVLYEKIEKGSSRKFPIVSSPTHIYQID